MNRQIRLYTITFIFAYFWGVTLIHGSDSQCLYERSLDESAHNNFSDGEVDMMCGPNCLWQIAYAYDKKYSLQAIVSMAGTTPQDGTTVKGMVEATRKMGLQAKAVRANIRALTELQCVAILLLRTKDINHYVILDKIENGQIRLLDGDKFTNLSIKELKSIWDGYAILIGDQGYHRTGRVQRHFGTGLQISGLVMLLVLTAYAVKSTYSYLSKR